MLGISFSEAVVILLIGFLVIGPKKMTDLAYQAGMWVSKLKQQIKTIKETQFDPLKDSVFYDPTIEMNKPLSDLTKTPPVPQSTAHPQISDSPK